MKSEKYAASSRKRCVACGACAKECPKGAIEIWNGSYAVIDSNICVGCGRCRSICPAECIELYRREG